MFKFNERCHNNWIFLFFIADRFNFEVQLKWHFIIELGRCDWQGTFKIPIMDNSNKYVLIWPQSLNYPP